jgi:hypothetical protein
MGKILAPLLDRSTWLRVAAIAAAALLAAGAVGLLEGERQTRQRLHAELAATASAGESDLRRELAFAGGAAAGEAALARALVHRGLAGEAPTSDLERAQHLARRVLARRPASAEAAMLLGLATRLGLEARRDPALYGRREIWERPLRAAVALAPGDPEPRRALAGSLLSIWFALSSNERDSTRELLRGAFLDTGTFDRLIAAWVRAAWRPDAVFSIMPDTPAAWDRLESIYAGAQAWPAWRDTDVRRRQILRRDLERRLAEARRQLGEGDPRPARLGFLAVLAEAPPERDFADLAEVVLARCPAGVNNPRQAPALRGWLRWGVERFLYGQPGFDATSLDRLAAASGDLPGELQALAALAAGQLRRAEMLEERAQAQWSERWGVYLMAKASQLAERPGESSAARTALARVHRSWQGTPTYWRTKAFVAGAASDAAGAAEARQRLAAMALDRWEATDWRQIGGRSLLEFYADRDHPRATLTLDNVPGRGAAIQIQMDGASLGVFALSPRQPRVELELAATAGIHLLELRTLAGERVAPGEFRFETRAPR